ncbi:uncharacterized protein LOC143594448 [Bidens hawaiensis]|uniref:uncharacterized protein LOC143594448 n=1 Tax=Bidens hawaiensis TaxID=980011 RepID=UPI004049D24F
MGQVNNYLWSTILKQTTPADRNPIAVVKVNLQAFIGGEAVTTGNLINVSLVYLNDYNGPLDFKKEFMSLMGHEMTHCFQWNGANTAPVNVVEGIADYTILKANLYLRYMHGMDWEINGTRGKPVEQLWKDYQAKYPGVK